MILTGNTCAIFYQPTYVNFTETVSYQIISNFRFVPVVTTVTVCIKVLHSRTTFHLRSQDLSRTAYCILFLPFIRRARMFDRSIIDLLSFHTIEGTMNSPETHRR